MTKSSTADKLRFGAFMRKIERKLALKVFLAGGYLEQPPVR